jgi:hypothetical protein
MKRKRDIWIEIYINRRFIYDVKRKSIYKSNYN